MEVILIITEFSKNIDTFLQHLDDFYAFGDRGVGAYYVTPAGRCVSHWVDQTGLELRIPGAELEGLDPHTQLNGGFFFFL